MTHDREEISMYYQLKLIVIIKIISETKKNKTISTTQNNSWKISFYL